MSALVGNPAVNMHSGAKRINLHAMNICDSSETIRDTSAWRTGGLTRAGGRRYSGSARPARRQAGDRTLSCDVEVRVLNVSHPGGTVRLALCTAAQWLSSGYSASVAVPARTGVVTAMLMAVKPGTYGLLAHHDANGDGRINRDLLGRPTEGIGFSRNAPMLFGPPRFIDAAFTLAPGRAVIEVTLRFEPSPPRTRPRAVAG